MRALLILHAQQQLVVRARALGSRERQDQLRIQVQPPLLDGVAQLVGDADVGEAAHDAAVALLIDLDAVAAAILGGLAGGLGGGEHVRQLIRGRQRRHADADRHRCAFVGLQQREPFGALAQRFGEALSVTHLGRQQHDEAIA